MSDTPLAKPFWTYGDLVFLSLLYLFLSVAILSLAGPAPVRLLAAQGAVYVAWFGCIAALFRYRYGQPFWSSLDWRVGPGWALRSVLSGLLLMIAVTVLGNVLRLPEVHSPVRDLLESSSSQVLAAVSIAAAGPVAEELAFRGLLQPLLGRSFGPLTGLILAAIPFGLLHGPQLKHSWPNVAMVIAAGAVFGWIRHRADSTLAAALAHMSYNTSLLAAFFIQGNHG